MSFPCGHDDAEKTGDWFNFKLFQVYSSWFVCEKKKKKISVLTGTTPEFNCIYFVLGPD